jgi:hypothetical protein
VRRPFSGKFYSLSSILVTIFLTIVVWWFVTSIEQKVSAGWVGSYKTGFPFVYEGGGPAITPIPDPSTGKLIQLGSDSGYYSRSKYWANWLVFLAVGLVLNAFFRFGIFSSHRILRLISRYFLACIATLTLYPLLFGDIDGSSSGAGIPFPFFSVPMFKEHSNSAVFIPSRLAMDLICYLTFATVASFTHGRLLKKSI